MNKLKSCVVPVQGIFTGPTLVPVQGIFTGCSLVPEQGILMASQQLQFDPLDLCPGRWMLSSKAAHACLAFAFALPMFQSLWSGTVSRNFFFNSYLQRCNCKGWVWARKVGDPCWGDRRYLCSTPWRQSFERHGWHLWSRWDGPTQ